MIERIEARGKTLLIPVDHVVSQSFNDTQNIRTTTDNKISENEILKIKEVLKETFVD